MNGQQLGSITRKGIPRIVPNVTLVPQNGIVWCIVESHRNQLFSLEGKVAGLGASQKI